MGRPHRRFEPESWYHLYTRGSGGAPICDSDSDRVAFLRLFKQTAARYDISVVAYALLDNHYHGVIQVGKGNVSSAMQELHGGHARRMARRRGTDAHVFRNRFRVQEIEGEIQLLETIRYVLRNPVKHGLCNSPGEWLWSSYRGLADQARCEGPLDVDTALRVFDENDPRRARDRLVRFVDWESLEQTA
jgi:putative transposase